jgi:hypothetical protein
MTKGTVANEKLHTGEQRIGLTLRFLRANAALKHCPLPKISTVGALCVIFVIMGMLTVAQWKCPILYKLRNTENTRMRWNARKLENEELRVSLFFSTAYQNGCVREQMGTSWRASHFCAQTDSNLHSTHTVLARKLQQPKAWRCEDNIKIDVREIGCVGIDWIWFAYDTV